MEFETVERCGRIHVIVNGVESAGFIERDRNGRDWGRWDFVYVAVGSADEGLAHLANALGDWYTAAEAAERLVKLGAYDVPPSAHDVCAWARLDLLPGSMKITGKGGAGRGGSWRIPGKAIAALAERRKQ